MANGFSITIGAKNNTGGALEKINKSLTALQAPTKNFAKQVDKFKELSGLKKVGQGFDGIVRSSLGAARSLTRVAEPLAAITGAASIGGFAALISKWAELNTTLGFSAQRMGVSAEYLGRLRSQANLAGASGDDAQAGFESLGQTLYDVANGQAPQAAYIMSRLGISLMDATGHARKAQDVLPQLEAAIRGVRDPLAQARLATMFFGGAAAGMLPVLRMTNAELEENRQRVLRYGGVTNQGVAAATQFELAQRAVGQSVIGLTDAIETQLAPVISPLLLDFANWTAKGRTSWLVTTGLGEAVKDFGGWIKTIDFTGIVRDVKGFGTEVENVLGLLGLWKTKLDNLTGKNAPSVPGMPQPSPFNNAIDAVTGNDRNVPSQGLLRERYDPMSRFLYDHFSGVRRIYNAIDGDGGQVSTPDSKAQAALAQHAMGIFQSLGWSPADAAGMAAGVQRESGFNPGAAGDFVKGVPTAFGAGQWHADRQANFAKWAGFDIHDPRATLDKQLQFYSFERTGGSEQLAGRMIRAAAGPGEAGAADSLFGQRPGDAVGEAGFRARLAESLFKATPTWADVTIDGVASPGLSGGGAPVAAAAANDTDTRFGAMIQQLRDATPPASEALSAAAGASGAPGASGRVDVTIASPAGMKTTARASGNVNAPKIATAMPGAGPNAP